MLGADFVTTEDGTGLVHMAPGFGEDDQKVCEANDIGLVVPVDEKGRFTSEIRDFAGENVLAATKAIIRRLKEDGALIQHVTYEHNYPHCWRTDEPIIYMAIPSWYVEVTKMRAQATEYLDAMSKRDEPRAKAAWAMNSDENVDLSDINDEDLDASIASPPYHFRCRTITVAYF